MEEGRHVNRSAHEQAILWVSEAIDEHGEDLASGDAVLVVAMTERGVFRCGGGFFFINEPIETYGLRSDGRKSMGVMVMQT